jgi:uncharacterized cupredoxin-like copper-binding protein
MSTKIGHFEILSELSKSATGTVFKANDPQTGQTVALKAIQLSAFGARAAELEKCLLAEAETTKVLSHSNLITVYGAGEIEGQFCAAMEYIQGNSIATMLARKEGFSIWDLLDIGRQMCAGLDHAQTHNAVHFSLEPAKIMCGWDGMVRILGYGVSSVGKFTEQMPGVPAILHYMSPEQVRGESIDARSNLFSVGAMFYEMVTDHPAFEGADAESLRQSILESTPPAPITVNLKINPLLSDLIMKALAKDPAGRYQNGRELLDDLEKCKESKTKAAKEAAAPVQGIVIPDAVKAANQAKFIAAAQAAAPRSASASAAGQAVAPAPAVPAIQTPKIQASATVSAPSMKPPAKVAPSPSASMSAPVLDAPVAPVPRITAAAAEAPKIAVDPMMADDGPARGGSVSFSEMTELPPLKEIYIAPPPPPPTFEQQSTLSPAHAPGGTMFEGDQESEKPKTQPREVAEKAIKEIKNVPPRLVIYSIAGAAVLILIIAVALVLHVNSLNSDGDTPRPVTADATPQPAPAQPAPQSRPAPTPPPVAEAQPAPEVQSQPEPTRAPAVAPRGRKNKKMGTVPAVAAVVPGQMEIDSTPQGAQIQIDGKSDPAWVTPVVLSGLDPGQHSVTVSKTGYVTDTRTVAVNSGSKASFVTRLTLLTATLAVTSTPAGANVYIDGKDTGKVTPAQVPVEKGQHVVLVRKSSFIDETTSAQFVLGQTVSFSPTLRSLGNVDDIKTVGKMNKLFGGKAAAGMGAVVVRTQPKGAQIAVNQHMLEKSSPVDFVVDPGNYVVDITLTGYASIHKVITVDKGGKAVIDEVLQHE